MLAIPAVAAASGSTPAAGTTAAAKATKLTLSSSLDPSVAGTAVSFTATVAPSVSGGVLTFTINGAPVPGCAVVPMTGLSGVDCSVPLPIAGAYTVAATYSGGQGYAASSAFLVQTVVDPATVSQSSSATSPVSVVIAGLPSPSAENPTISYTETGSVASTICRIDGQQTYCASARATLHKLAVGPHTFQVSVSGGGVSSTAEVSWVVLTPTTSTSPAKKKTAGHTHKSRRARPL
jgi:hypothetical protein